MKGYYKCQEATDDVLMGGENIEPVPIEDKIYASDAILQNMFSGQELTQTLRLRRSVFDDLYSKEMKSLFK